jgi:CheY-like chemotaxis protein
MAFRQAVILLIEDNPSDARYTQLALADLGIANSLTIIPDGEEAILYLYKKGKYTDAPRPDAILLDWNLPKADGSEVLEIIRRDSSFNVIPVVILTGSREQTDVLQAYHLQATGYVTKPIDLSGVQTIMDCCEFRIVLTPKSKSVV